MLNRVLLGVIAGQRVVAPAPSYTLRVAVGTAASGAYLLLYDQNLNSISVPQPAREVTGLGYDPDRSVLSMANIGDPPGNWLDLETYTLTAIGSIAEYVPRGLIYCPSNDEYLHITQNTPRGRRFRADDYSYVGLPATLPSNNPTVTARTPDGSKAVVGMESGTGRQHVYNLSDYSKRAFSGSTPSGSVRDVSCSNDLYSLVGGNSLYLYDFSTMSDYRNTFDVSGQCDCAAVSPDSLHIAVGSGTEPLRYGEIFSVNSDNAIYSLSPQPSEQIDRIAYSPSGEALVVATRSSISIYETAGYTRVSGPVSKPTGATLALQFIETIL